MASHFIVGHRTGWLSGDSNNRAGDLGRYAAGQPIRRREIMVHSWIAGAKLGSWYERKGYLGKSGRQPGV